MKKLLKASAISGAEFIVSLSVLISVILRFVQDLRELSYKMIVISPVII